MTGDSFKGKVLIFIFVGIASWSEGLSQQNKPPIDTSVFRKWPSMRLTGMSRNGQYLSYTFYNLSDTVGKMFIQSTRSKWRRELRTYSGVFSRDSRYYLYIRGDSLFRYEIEKDQLQYIASARNFTLCAGSDFLIYLNGQSPWENGAYLLRNIATGQERLLDSTHWYALNGNGSILAYETIHTAGVKRLYTLHWLDLNKGTPKLLWQGEGPITNPSFDKTGDRFEFLVPGLENGKKSFSVWYYAVGQDTAAEIANNTTLATSDLYFSEKTLDMPSFDKDGAHLRIPLEKGRPELPKNNSSTGVPLDIWHYKDEGGSPGSFAMREPEDLQVACIEIENRKVSVLKLTRGTEQILASGAQYAIVAVMRPEEYWRRGHTKYPAYLVNIENGSRQMIRDDLGGHEYWDFKFTPDGKFVLYYDPASRNYFSYEIEIGRTRNLTNSLQATWWESQYFGNQATLHALEYPVGIMAWTADNRVLVYEKYDIWALDPSGTIAPVNITEGYGERHGRELRLITEYQKLEDPTDPSDIPTLTAKDSIFLEGFSPATKCSGIFSLVINNSPKVRELCWGSYHLGAFKTAFSMNTWVFSRESAETFPNLYITHNGRIFDTLTNEHPEKDYNWVTAELVKWKLPDGSMAQGILYKPENFNPRKKYPLLFKYYEKQSDWMYVFQKPDMATKDINITYFVSRGYLVFLPDISYKIGHPGASALNAVESAAKYLCNRKYIDAGRMGIVGHSFGGFETEFIITHSHLFAAAVSACGVGDMVSFYDDLKCCSGHVYCEDNQGRMGKPLWSIPRLYIENSSVFKADHVTTPLLMVANKNDDRISWTQGMEFFSALHRLEKRVWCLQYDNGAHSLEGRDALDYTIRLEQFFDHYLKGAPPPKWMVEGIAKDKKGIETGYELEPGKQP